MSDDATSPAWDCRWPDPVALQVAAERLLDGLADTRKKLNRNIKVTVRMEPSPHPDALTRAVIAAPWGVERVYWNPPGVAEPPIESAYPLEADEAGRVARGQGMMLDAGKEGKKPILIAWEPETGHYFVETLLHSVLGYSNAEEALRMAGGGGRVEPRKQPKKSVTQHLEKEVSRRGLFDLFRRG